MTFPTEKIAETIHSISAPTLAVASQIQSLRAGGGETSSIEALRSRVIREIESAAQGATERGFDSADVADLRYALAALVDELALTHNAEIRDYWLPRLIQLELFQENTAGEGFFVRLEAARERRRLCGVAVFYICLLFGFRGLYRVRGKELALEELTLDVGRQLESAGVIRSEEPLAPSAKAAASIATRTLKGRGLLWASISVLMAAVVAYIGLRLELEHRSESTISTIESWTQPQER